MSLSSQEIPIVTGLPIFSISILYGSIFLIFANMNEIKISFMLNAPTILIVCIVSSGSIYIKMVT